MPLGLGGPQRFALSCVDTCVTRPANDDPGSVEPGTAHVCLSDVLNNFRTP